MSQINGRISQIIGPVIDVYFDTKGENPEKVLPKIYEAIVVGVIVIVAFVVLAVYLRRRRKMMSEE